MHHYTPEQRQFIYENVKGTSRKELTDKFNERFGLNLGLNQISSFVTNHKLKSGLSARFKKGQKPWNAGMKGLNFGGKETQFKKGQKSFSHLQVGTETVNIEGFVYLKIEDPNVWRLKHQVVYERHYGTIPDNHAVIFADGNRRNMDINNLVLVHRSQLALLNKNGYITNDPETLKAGLKLIEINKKIYHYDVKGNDYDYYQQIAEKKGIREGTFIARLKRKWTYEQAAYKPINSRVHGRGELQAKVR